jgi:hypothetical protein
MYKNNSRDSSKFKGYSPHQLSCNMTRKHHAIGYYSYTQRYSDYLTLEIKERDISNLHFQLFDMNGKLLQSEKITDNQTSIFMSNLVSANYFVKVIKENKEVKTFKIIKN